jgi:hypothetical protein
VKLQRDIILFGTLAVVALVGGWYLLANRPGGDVDAFVRESDARAQTNRATLVTAETFRATVCASSPCVLVEAGGMAFIFGAGEGAADGLGDLGLMRPDIDAIMLPDLKLETIAGLPGLARASLIKGRTEQLNVYGPSGVVPAVDGANLMLSGDQAARLVVGAEKEDQGLEGLVVFDSGVVSIRAFGGGGRGESQVYRLDFEGKSLVLAGCGATADQIFAAARGTKTVAGVLAAGAPELAGENRSVCITIGDVLEAAGQARLSGILLSPLQPSPVIPGAKAAWREIVAEEKASGAIVGGPGAVLDLSGEKLVVRGTN